MMPGATYIAGAGRWPRAVQHPTLPDKLFSNAHGGLVIAAPPPGSGSTAVGIVCNLREGSALIALGNCLVSRGFLSESPLTSSPVCRAAGIAFSPMPWVCAGSTARPKNSVGSARPQLPNYRARRLPNRYPRITLDPSHGLHSRSDHGPEAGRFCPKSGS